MVATEASTSALDSTTLRLSVTPRESYARFIRAWFSPGGLALTALWATAVLTALIVGVAEGTPGIYCLGFGMMTMAGSVPTHFLVTGLVLRDNPNWNGRAVVDKDGVCLSRTSGTEKIAWETVRKVHVSSDVIRIQSGRVLHSMYPDRPGEALDIVVALVPPSIPRIQRHTPQPIRVVATLLFGAASLLALTALMTLWLNPAAIAPQGWIDTYQRAASQYARAAGAGIVANVLAYLLIRSIILFRTLRAAAAQ